jgi:DNA polymerase-3 subunit delta'
MAGNGSNRCFASSGSCSATCWTDRSVDGPSVSVRVRSLTSVPDVFSEVISQADVVAALRQAVAASHGDPEVPASAMTHAWLFTGPAGSGRSVGARSFAAALQCPNRGCGSCVHCRTVLHGTHGDVRNFNPEGLSIAVREMRAVVQAAARRPTTGRWQIVLIEDADRLTEGAANALLKVVEEPSPHTVFLLCSPSLHPDDIPITIRSRCRVVSFGSPSVSDIADLLQRRDGVAPEDAERAASIAGGHVGRARRLARDPEARDTRREVLRIPTALRDLASVYECAATLLERAKRESRALSERLDAAELEELKTALGAGGTGKGAATAVRGTVGVLRDLERKQKSRATRTERDVLDGALIDLSGFFRDVIALSFDSEARLTNPDLRDELTDIVDRIGASGALVRLEAILNCREAIEANVKPQVAVEAMMMSLFTGR